MPEAYRPEMSGLFRRCDEAPISPSSRRLHVKRFLTGALMLLLMNVPAFAQQSSPPIIPFDSVPNALKLPYGMYLGEASGVAVNSKGHVFVFSRGNSSGPAYAATAAQLLEFDQNGNYVREKALRVVVRAFGARRSPRQYLGRRQRLRHGREVHARRPRVDGVRPQTRSVR